MLLFFSFSSVAFFVSIAPAIVRIGQYFAKSLSATLSPSPCFLFLSSLFLSSLCSVLTLSLHCLRRRRKNWALKTSEIEGTWLGIIFAEFNAEYYSVNAEKDISTEKKIHVSPENYCRSINELFNSSFSQLHLIRRIKYYHTPCEQHANLSCFYDAEHLCKCHPSHHVTCVLFEHKKTHICQDDAGNCENGGQCFRDDPKCPTISACLCLDCFYGSKCQFSTRGFSLSLDNILGYQIRPERNFSSQLFVIRFSVILIGVMFVVGVINGPFSTLVFFSREAQKVGCGLYLLTTSFLSIVIMIMLAFKFTFLLLTQMSLITHMTVLRIQCGSTDFILQTCLSVNDWLNACVGIERATTVIQGTRFDQSKSKQIAKRILIFIWLMTILSNLHDPIYRRLIRDDGERRIWCIVRYPSAIHTYNSVIQILHLLVSFICNIASAVLIIYNIARRRSLVQRQQPFKDHIHKQLTTNKHLIISPIILVLFASPRMVISLFSGCMKPTRGPWLFLAGYFTSFAPALLVFAVFVLPSETYRSEFKKFFVKLAAK